MHDEYENNLNSLGINSEATILAGLNYAHLLYNANYLISAERLITKLVTISRRVNGSDHKTTINADKSLKQYKVRCVVLLPDYKPFQALRYDDNDGEICVIRGPITEPRNVEDERTYHIANKLVIPCAGCPVICHGMVSASHLNGMLGEVRLPKKVKTGTRLSLGAL